MMNIWVVTSLLILLSSTYLVTVHGDETHATFDGEPFSTDGCEGTRGCFDCRENLESCEVNMAWEPNEHENVVKFTLWGTKVATNAHVSVGITSSPNMFSADVYSCISDETGMVVARSWNPASGRTTNPRTLKGVSDVVVTEVGGQIRCQFTRNMSLGDGDAEFFDISGDTSYFLILSAGSAGGGRGFGHTGGTNRGLSGAVILSQTEGTDLGHLSTDRGISQVTSAGNLVMSQFGVWTLLWSLIVACHVTK